MKKTLGVFTLQLTISSIKANAQSIVHGAITADTKPTATKSIIMNNVTKASAELNSSTLSCLRDDVNRIHSLYRKQLGCRWLNQTPAIMWGGKIDKFCLELWSPIGNVLSRQGCSCCLPCYAKANVTVWDQSKASVTSPSRHFCDLAKKTPKQKRTDKLKNNSRKTYYGKSYHKQLRRIVSNDL